MKQNSTLHLDSPITAGIKRKRNDSDDGIEDDDNGLFLSDSDNKRQRVSYPDPLLLSSVPDAACGTNADEGHGGAVVTATASTMWSHHLVGQDCHPSLLSIEEQLLPTFVVEEGQPTLSRQQQQQQPQPPIRISLAEPQDPDDIFSFLLSSFMSTTTTTPAILNVPWEHYSCETTQTNDSGLIHKHRSQQNIIATHFRIFKALCLVRYPQTHQYVEWILQRFPDQIHLQILAMIVLRHWKLWEVSTTVVMKSMSQHEFSWNLHLTGFALLAECVERSPEARAILRCSRDHVLYMFHAMQRFENEPRILCNASATLCWILHEENHRRESNPLLPNDMIPEATAIVKQLVHRYHRRDASILGNLVCLLTVWEIDTNDFDGLKELILDGMKYHLQNIKVQEACLRWLHCALPRFALDCLQTVLQSMKWWRNHHHESSSMISSSSHFIAKACRLLAFWIPDHSRELLQSTAVEVVLAALRRFPQDAKTVLSAELFLNGIITINNEQETTNPNGNHHHHNSHSFGGGPHVIDFIFQGLGIQQGEHPDEQNVAQRDNIQELEPN
jgi:hypothetical protein